MAMNGDKDVDTSAKHILNIKEKSDKYRHRIVMVPKVQKHQYRMSTARSLPTTTTMTTTTMKDGSILTPDDIPDMRDQSILTVDTQDSGMYSSDLLQHMDPISDVESDIYSDTTLVGENLQQYAAEESSRSILVDDSNIDEVEMDLSLSSYYYNDIMKTKIPITNNTTTPETTIPTNNKWSSSWSSTKSDRPFDEVTDFQQSEKGDNYDGFEAILAGDTTIVREDVFPPIPASYDGMIRSEEKNHRTARGVSWADGNDSYSTENRRSCGIGRKFMLFLCFLIVLLLVGAVLVGWSVSRRNNNDQQSSAVESTTTESVDNNNGTSATSPSQSPSEITIPEPTSAGRNDDDVDNSPSSPPVVSPTANTSETPPPSFDGESDLTDDSTASPSFKETELSTSSPSWSPTWSPSSSPTFSTSSSPTESPTSSPSSSPTSSPTSNPPSDPTSSPTVTGSAPPSVGCDDRITVVQKCYDGIGNAIEMEFMNCDPQPDDWVVVDLDGADFTNPDWLLANPTQYIWQCGVDLECNGTVDAFGVEYPEDSARLSFVQLRAYLARRIEVDGPFEIIAVSRRFLLTFPCG
jgi:hypothetical protein